jgi:hypothetical protein
MSEYMKVNIIGILITALLLVLAGAVTVIITRVCSISDDIAVVYLGNLACVLIGMLTLTAFDRIWSR